MGSPPGAGAVFFLPCVAALPRDEVRCEDVFEVVKVEVCGAGPGQSRMGFMRAARSRASRDMDETSKVGPKILLAKHVRSSAAVHTVRWFVTAFSVLQVCK